MELKFPIPESIPGEKRNILLSELMHPYGMACDRDWDACFAEDETKDVLVVKFSDEEDPEVVKKEVEDLFSVYLQAAEAGDSATI